MHNNACTPQLIDDLPPTPQSLVVAVTEVLVALGRCTPCPCQIDCFFQLRFITLDMMHLIHKCVDGKSLVIRSTATILRGVTVVIFPLIGLGNDQISKTKRPETGVKACHKDEFRYKN